MWREKKSILERRSAPTNFSGEFFNGDIQSINAQNGNYLSGILGKMEESLNSVNQATAKYDSLVSAVDNAMRLVEQSERNGAVEADAGNSTYSPTASVTSSLESNSLGEKPERDTAQMVSDVPSSSISSDVKESEATSLSLSVGTVSGENIGSSSLGQGSSAQEISTLAVSDFSVNPSSFTSTNPFGAQTIGATTWSRFSNVEQIDIIGKLQDVGYSQEEIKMIISGSASVAKVEVSALANSLQQGIKDHPELRDELIQTYGFDIFDEDGNVDSEKLALALIIDHKNENDEYSITELLHSKYGIDIVEQEEYNQISQKIEELLKDNGNIRDEIHTQYGFDIFNEDGKVNRDKLSLAILMDKQDDNDEFNLKKFFVSIEEKTSEIDTFDIGVKTLSGVNLLGVTPRGSAFLSSQNNN